jgi:hypothetical protein
MDVEDLEVYQKLCQLHIEVCDLTHTWPQEEKYELGSQARRSSNSAPAQLAEKNDIHHLFMAKLKEYITEKVYLEFKGRYKECIRMLNGLEKTLERKIPERERRWQVTEGPAVYGLNDKPRPQGWPINAR